jgi:hypothetical protein
LPIAVAVVITVERCRKLSRRCHTVAVAADGSALELRALRGSEAVELARPVGLRIHRQTFPVVDSESGAVSHAHRTDLFVTSAGRSTVISALGLGRAQRRESGKRLERFAHDAAAVLGTDAPVVEEIATADGFGHRRHDPTTRWVNGGYDPRARDWRVSLLVVAPLVTLVSWAAPPAALVLPASPHVVGAAEVDAELADALDDLEGDIGRTSLVVGPAASGDAGVERHACERDHEWFWGPVDATRLTASARVSVSSARAASLRQALRSIASPSMLSESVWLYPGKTALALEPGPPQFQPLVGGVFEISVDDTQVEVVTTTDCVEDGDLDRLQATLADHATRAANALTGPN